MEPLPEKGAERLQFERGLADLPVSEQIERLKPERPFGSQCSPSANVQLKGFKFAKAGAKLKLPARDEDEAGQDGQQTESQDPTTAEAEKAAAVANHNKQQARVYTIVLQALATVPDQTGKLDDFKTMLHNSAEWIATGECTLSVLTPTHDYKARINGQKAFFDQTVRLPNMGGDYPTETSKTDDPRLAYFIGGAGGDMSIGGKDMRLALEDEKSDEEIKQYLIHEAQHDADQSYPGQDYEEGPDKQYDDWRSEFRAYKLESGEGSGREDKYGSPDRPAKNAAPFTVTHPDTGKVYGPVKTGFLNEYQERYSRKAMELMYEFGIAYWGDNRGRS